MPKYGPYAREIVLAKVDGRSREGRLLTQVRRALIEQLGGETKLSPAQRLLVDRAAHMQLRCAKLDARLIDGTYTPYDNSTHAAFSNALRRTLLALHLETPIGAGPPSLDEHLARLRREGEAAA